MLLPFIIYAKLLFCMLLLFVYYELHVRVSYPLSEFIYRHSSKRTFSDAEHFAETTVIVHYVLSSMLFGIFIGEKLFGGYVY